VLRLCGFRQDLAKEQEIVNAEKHTGEQRAPRATKRKARVDYLTHYYKNELGPFQSLSALPDEEAIRIMEELCDDTLFGARFKDPALYLRNRRETEQWVREGFTAKGGKPQAPYPISMVLGSSKWMMEQAPAQVSSAEIRIPLSIFTKYDVSFTYPDSMISLWFGRDKPSEYYQPEYHGKIFTISEILSIVEAKGLPEEGWETNLPSDLAPYIEAQVWNHKLLIEYEKRAAEKKDQRPTPASR
jgi:hypothetical protein